MVVVGAARPSRGRSDPPQSPGTASLWARKWPQWRRLAGNLISLRERAPQGAPPRFDPPPTSSSSSSSSGDFSCPFSRSWTDPPPPPPPSPSHPPPLWREVTFVVKERHAKFYKTMPIGSDMSQKSSYWSLLRNII